MEITFDPRKRDRTLAERGIDFADAAEVFAGDHTVLSDDRFAYGEPRFISAGFARPDGRDRMDAAEFGPAHYLHEVLSCQRRSKVAQAPGLTPTTRPN